MTRFPYIASLFFALMLFCCTQVERDNPYDPDGVNYNFGGDEPSSDSGSGGDEPSSSSEPGSLAPSSGSLAPGSSSLARSSSSLARSSSGGTSSSSGICTITSGYCLYSGGPNDCWPMPTDDCCEYGIIVANKAACSSTVVKYCNWGTCVGGNGWYCNGGVGCFMINDKDTEANCISGGATVVDCCPTDTRPPSANYPVCSIVSSSSVAPPISSSVAPSSNSSVPSSSSLASSGLGDIIMQYGIVVIGTQTWMAKNLDYVVEGSKCYNNNPSNCATYGRLYNWLTAMALPSSCTYTPCSSQINSPHRGICPVGWHIPSGAEWDALMTAVGGSNTAGKHLKSKTGWNPYSGIENLDTYGFSALPGGYGGSGGDFFNAGDYGYWWSATEGDVSNAYRLYMDYHGDYVSSNYDLKSVLRSVRCLQDSK